MPAVVVDGAVGAGVAVVAPGGAAGETAGDLKEQYRHEIIAVLS